MKPAPLVVGATVRLLRPIERVVQHKHFTPEVLERVMAVGTNGIVREVGKLIRVEFDGLPVSIPVTRAWKFLVVCCPACYEDLGDTLVCEHCGFVPEAP